MILRLFPSIALALPGFVLADAQEPRLEIHAETPQVTIGPLPPGRRFLNLPDLEYRVSLTAGCPDGWQATQLSLSIADTRTTVTPDTGPAPLAAEITVPAAQLAPLPVSGFCTADAGGDNAAGESQLTVEAALSAQASLLCVSEGNERRRTFTSKPLGLTLVCEHASPAPAGPPGD